MFLAWDEWREGRGYLFRSNRFSLDGNGWMDGWVDGCHVMQFRYVRSEDEIEWFKW